MADKKPKVADSEMDKLEKQFEAFDENVKTLTMERMNQAPKLEMEPQTKLSSSEIDKSKEIYLRPERSLNAPQKFNERFQKDWEFAKEYVQFIAENNEIKGEAIEIWTRPFGGKPAEFWRVPVNKPVWGPRYLAEQLKKKFYHRLSMDQTKATETTGVGTMYGAIVVDNTIQRLDARPVSSRKSIFMGA